MAITLAQSLGQNIGIFSDKKRILNGTQPDPNEPSISYLSSTRLFIQGHSYAMEGCWCVLSFISRRVQVWRPLVGLHHGWCWVSDFTEKSLINLKPQRLDRNKQFNCVFEFLQYILITTLESDTDMLYIGYNANITTYWKEYCIFCWLRY